MKHTLFTLLICLLATSASAADKKPQAKPKRNVDVGAVVTPAANEQRVALVIGNSSYKDSPLKNPVNDAKDVATKLRGLGFEVIERNNLQSKQIGRTLSEFRSKLTPGAVALVFYAGHGLQIKGENYLPTVDADISAEEDVPNQSLSVKQIMDVLEGAKTRLNLVFLDACRNNPYSRSFRSGAGDGLARVSAPSGTLISYATRPGSVAADGDGRNGLYTSKLLAQMGSNQQIELTLKLVVTEVKTASQGKQEPWMEGSIEGDFCFGGCNVGVSVQVATLNPEASSASRVQSADEVEQEYWSSIKTSQQKSDFEDYLSQYPKGRFVVLAKQKLKTMGLAIAPVAPAVPAKPTSTAPVAAPQSNFDEPATNVATTKRHNIPLPLSEEVWKAIESSELYRNAPRPRSIKVSAKTSVETEYTGSVSRSLPKPSPIRQELIKETAPLDAQCSVHKDRSTITGTTTDTHYFACGINTSLGDLVDGKTSSYISRIDELKGSLFPMSIGAKMSIRTINKMSGDLGSFSISYSCEVVSQGSALDLHPKLTGAAWKAHCGHTVTFSNSDIKPHIQEYDDYYLEDLGVSLSSIGMYDGSSAVGRWILPSSGSRTVLNADDPQYGSRTTTTFLSYDWTVGD